MFWIWQICTYNINSDIENVEAESCLLSHPHITPCLSVVWCWAGCAHLVYQSFFFCENTCLPRQGRQEWWECTATLKLNDQKPKDANGVLLSLAMIMSCFFTMSNPFQVTCSSLFHCWLKKKHIDYSAALPKCFEFFWHNHKKPELMSKLVTNCQEQIL